MKGRAHGTDAGNSPHLTDILPTPTTETVYQFLSTRGKYTALTTSWLARTGFLTPLTLLLLFAARHAHRSGRMPPGYTWESAYTSVRSIFAQPGTVSIFFLAFLIGRWRHRGSLNLASVAFRFRQPVSWDDIQAWRIPACAALASVAVGVDAIAFEGHSTLDSFCILCSCILAFYARPAFSPVKVVGFLVLAAILHVLTSYSFTVFKALIFSHQSSQDARIMAWESALFGEPPHRAVARWAAAHPAALQFADRAYFYLFEHMLLLSAFLVGTRQFRDRNQYLATITLCTLLGGPLYHLLPGYGPLWADPEHYQHLAQHHLRVTGLAEALVYNQQRIHTTPRGVLYSYMYIACMPSLHMANETIMLWHSRHSRIAFTLASCSFVLTAFATMALGWHYALDLLFGALFAVALVLLCRWGGSRWFPAALDAADEPLPPRPTWRDWRDRLLCPTPTSPVPLHPSPTRLPA